MKLRHSQIFCCGLYLTRTDAVILNCNHNSLIELNCYASSHPSGGHVLWVELPAHFDALELYEQAYQHQISIAPGSMFSASVAYQNCFRLNCGLPWSEQLDQAMKILGNLIKNINQ